MGSSDQRVRNPQGLGARVPRISEAVWPDLLLGLGVLKPQVIPVGDLFQVQADVVARQHPVGAVAGLGLSHRLPAISDVQLDPGAISSCQGNLLKPSGLSPHPTAALAAGAEHLRQPFAVGAEFDLFALTGPQPKCHKSAYDVPPFFAPPLLDSIQ